MIEPTAAGRRDAAAGPGPVPLRRNSGFRMFWIGQLLSDTGTEIGLLAYPLLILALTHSPLIAGLLVQHVSGAWAVGAFAATMAMAAVLRLTLPGLRQTQTPPSPGRGAG